MPTTIAVGSMRASLEQRRNLAAEVLAIAVHRERMREAARREVPHARQERRAFARIALVAQDLGAGKARPLGGPVVGTVVDDENGLEMRARVGDHRRNRRGALVRGNQDRWAYAARIVTRVRQAQPESRRVENARRSR